MVRSVEVAVMLGPERRHQLWVTVQLAHDTLALVDGQMRTKRTIALAGLSLLACDEARMEDRAEPRRGHSFCTRTERSAIKLDGGDECAIRGFVSGTNLGFSECGDVDESDKTAVDAALSCLDDAIPECQPTHLRYSGITFEGDPVWTDMFVTPEAGGCVLHVFWDSTEDLFGAGIVTHAVCSSFGKEVSAEHVPIVRASCTSEPDSCC